MSFSSRLIAVLCALQCGCLADAKPEADASRQPEKQLVIEDGAEPAPLLPGNEATLEVRYLDADGTPLSGESVEFDLSDTQSGASLAPAQAMTDDEGYARAQLHAGTSTASFTVRVTADGASAVSFDITVGDVVPPSAQVSVDYRGQRKATSISLTLVPGADCDDGPSMESSANADSQVIYRLEQLEQKGVFELDAGVSYALIAAARDDTNAKLASRCVEFEAPKTANPDEAVLVVEMWLDDVPLALGEVYPVTLGLDLQQPLARLAPAAANAVSALLAAGPAPAGTFYLDTVQAQLTPQQGASFAEARVAGALDEKLAMLLGASQSGPLQLASALASLVSELGPSCSVQGSYSTDGTARFHVAQLVALPNPSLGAAAKSVDLRAGALSGQAALAARYDEATAKLHIESLSLELGLGSYASALLASAREDPARFTARVAAAHGCANLGTLASMPSWPSAVPVATAVAACEQAAAGLVDRIEAAWQALDAAHPSIWLSGAVSVHDRNDDGVVDDLGPSALGGSWSEALGGAAADAVGATWQVPAATALAAL